MAYNGALTVTIEPEFGPPSLASIQKDLDSYLQTFLTPRPILLILATQFPFGNSPEKNV